MKILGHEVLRARWHIVDAQNFVRDNSQGLRNLMFKDVTGIMGKTCRNHASIQENQNCSLPQNSG